MDIREVFFNYRSYTPIPLLIALLILADPTPTTYAAGLVLVILGEVIRTWAVRHAGGATRTTSGVGGAELITHGPFAYVRNPLYLGNFFLGTGLVVMAWAWMPWMLLVFWGLFFLQYGMIISLEEEYLSKTFGELYAEYRKQVPRVIPRLTPFKKHDVQVMSWKRALRTERDTLMTYVLLSLAIYLRWKWLG